MPRIKYDSLKNMIKDGVSAPVRRQEKQDREFADASDAFEEAYGAWLEIFHLPSKDRIRFKAYIKSIEDSWEEDWNIETAYGRMDPIATFKGTVRKINLTLIAPARSLTEAVHLEREMSKLAAFTYPLYETPSGGATGISEPPLVRVKFGNRITHAQAGSTQRASTGGLLCIMHGFTKRFEMEEMDVVLPKPGYFIPKQTEINLSFTVLHEHMLGWDESGKPRAGMSHYPYLIRIGPDAAPIKNDDAPDEIIEAGGDFGGELRGRFDKIPLG